MTTIITVTNQKGGVGKTTSVISLAHGLALTGKRILIVDLDPQGQSAVSLGLNTEPAVFQLLLSPTTQPQTLLRHSGRENLWLIPGDQTTATAQIVMAAEQRPMEAIAQAIKPFEREFDFVIFDTAPSVGGIQERAVWAADLVLIPVATDYLAVDSLEKTIGMLSRFVQQGWRGQLAGILPTMYDTVTRESHSAMEYLSQQYNGKLLAPIRRATILRECSSDGRTIWEKASQTPVADDFQKLLQRVAKR